MIRWMPYYIIEELIKYIKDQRIYQHELKKLKKKMKK